MTEANLFVRFGVAMFIGMLIGLQRQYAFDEKNQELSAGARTFALLGLIGCGAAMAADQLSSPWAFVGILVIPGALLAINYYFDAASGKIGLTTETSAIIVLLTGALSYWQHLTLAVGLGVMTTVLLSIKLEMQRFVRHVTREDVFSTLKFAVISAIILPVLPNATFGPPPLNVLNPFKIWLLVVFISGIGFAGYILLKVLGPRKGMILLGILGGLASSTALTVGFSQRSRQASALSRMFAVAILLAWMVMFARLLLEVAAVNAVLVPALWLPITGLMLASMLAATLLVLSGAGRSSDEVPGFSNPFELKPAIKFGLIFTVVLVLSKLAQVSFGTGGIYASSLLTGLADVDAIALTVAELSLEPHAVSKAVAVHAILLAALANTVAKGAIVVIFGEPALRRAVLPGFVLIILSGVGFLVWL